MKEWEKRLREKRLREKHVDAKIPRHWRARARELQFGQFGDLERALSSIGDRIDGYRVMLIQMDRVVPQARQQVKALGDRAKKSGGSRDASLSMGRINKAIPAFSKVENHLGQLIEALDELLNAL